MLAVCVHIMRQRKAITLTLAVSVFLLVFAHSIETKTYNSKNEWICPKFVPVRNVVGVVVVAARSVALFVNLLNRLSYAHTLKYTLAHVSVEHMRNALV